MNTQSLWLVYSTFDIHTKTKKLWQVFSMWLLQLIGIMLMRYCIYNQYFLIELKFRIISSQWHKTCQQSSIHLVSLKISWIWCPKTCFICWCFLWFCSSSKYYIATFKVTRFSFCTAFAHVHICIEFEYVNLLGSP